jgi:hypothetical protein
LERRDHLSAESPLTECLPTCRRVLGDRNSLTFWYIYGLATCLRRQGRLDERHLDTLSSAHLGMLLRLLGSAVRAEPYAREARAGRLALQGAASRLTLASQLSLARLEGSAALAASIVKSGIQE